MRLINYTIFSTPTCHYCHLLKDWLSANGVNYDAKDVASDLQARQLMFAKSQQMGVPVSIIQLADETGKTSEHIIIGFAQRQLSGLLNIPIG